MSTVLSVAGKIDGPPPIELYPVYVVLAGLALLAFVAVGMVASRKRRREHGQLWFPEGFKTSEPSKKKRREPVGEDSVGLRSVALSLGVEFEGTTMETFFILSNDHLLSLI